MDQFFKFRAFVLIVEKQSFSKAGETLGVTTGAVSRTILRLEQEVHIRLFHRTTRSVMLTDEAKPYYETCCRMLEEMDEANRRIVRAREGDCGRLNLVHPALAGSMFARFVESYRDLAPKVNLNVGVQSSVCNLNDGRFGVAILPSHLLEQPTVIRRDLLTSPAALVASPEYLRRCGMPVRASALETRFLLLSQGAARSESRTIEMLEEGKRVKLIASSHMSGDELHVRASALAGVGIAVLPQAMVRDDIQSGSLVQVLPNCMVLSNGVELCLFKLFKAFRPRLRAISGRECGRGHHYHVLSLAMTDYARTTLAITRRRRTSIDTEVKKGCGLLRARCLSWHGTAVWDSDCSYQKLGS